jgi:hypothetical protein
LIRIICLLHLLNCVNNHTMALIAMFTPWYLQSHDNESNLVTLPSWSRYTS